jgi:hypothetical protein
MSNEKPNQSFRERMAAAIISKLSPMLTDAFAIRTSDHTMVVTTVRITMTYRII